MAWSEAEALCKSHPEHKQPAGVCSCCLRERLSKISGAVMDSSTMSSPAAAAAPYNYSSASSSCSSGCVSPRGHRRITSDVAGRFSFITVGGGDGGLKKSRSIAFAARRPARVLAGGKKKEGFWSKLIKSTGRRTKKAI
ncbi:PREDICTED: uncharacterized protein LOC109180250 [Ipomoea nil]|uniref:uncharacterized protein LOC109180250 n=1 Tax=Ipomoea nil TaxID=35883 RepID=UPI0009011B36|nr:PREDICTED: uncharacterized protein LOC109180250 [Ipomoea nil]